MKRDRAARLRRIARDGVLIARMIERLEQDIKAESWDEAAESNEERAFARHSDRCDDISRAFESARLVANGNGERAAKRLEQEGQVIKFTRVRTKPEQAQPEESDLLADRFREEDGGGYSGLHSIDWGKL